jgi:hypothetical protein
VLALVDLGDAAVPVEEDETRARGALVDRADVVSHGAKTAMCGGKPVSTPMFTRSGYVEGSRWRRLT